MDAKQHEDYAKEVRQLQITVDWVKNQTTAVCEENARIEKQISDLRKEVSTALDERLILKQQLLQTGQEDLDKLELIEETPYFGCIHFQEKYKETVEEVYIGKFGLYDSTVGEMLVLDWRAPMATIYYSGLDEEVAYRTPKGKVEGTMHVKRRYVIAEGELSEIHDEKSLQDRLAESIEGDSEFLIASLNKTTKGRLKEIVATIQQQQNAIIRSEALAPIIVQGVAGSGKTTIALHRMAYLMYNRQQTKNLHYMVVAPNKLFLNYIQDILPDLGVDDVYQTTFEDFALDILGKKYKLQKVSDKLDTLLVQEGEGTVIALGSKLRGSIALKCIIDRKLKQLEHAIIPKQHIAYNGMILFTYKEVQQTFLVSNQHMSLQSRIKHLGEYLRKRLKDKTALIKQAIEKQYSEKLSQLKEGSADIEQIRPQIIALYDERDDVIKAIPKWIQSYVKDYLKCCVLPDTRTFYMGLFEDSVVRETLLLKYASEEAICEMLQGFTIYQDAKLVELEDLAPLAYSHMKLYGIKDTTKYAHIVVDEAQDLDEMRVAVLREVSANDAFTFVGDLSQGIYDYKGITNWERMMERVFTDKQYQYFEMTTSYRSTIEIIDLANRVIAQCDDFKPLQAQPVLRHGDVPSLVECKDELSRIDAIVAQIKALQTEGMASICILTTHKEESIAVYETLKKHLALQWIGDETKSYEGGVVVMPGYLSKGLEFDAVCLYDVSRKQSLEPRDIKLLYVMITRALHRLYMYSVGEALRYLKD